MARSKAEDLSGVAGLPSGLRRKDSLGSIRMMSITSGVRKNVNQWGKAHPNIHQ